MKTDEERLDEVYHKVACRETLKPDEYQLILNDKNGQIRDLEEQVKSLAEAVNTGDQTIITYQEKLEALSNEFNKICYQRDALIRAIDKILK